MIGRSTLVVLAAFMVAGPVVAACPASPGAKVDIYPTAAELPENLLRLYVYFPHAMAPSEGLQGVVLLDDNGNPVNGAFLPTNQELWSPDRRRLTLLLDPGRVKSGLAAHELLGRALVPGQRYTLVVSGAMQDARGCAVGADTEYSFAVSSADYETPSPAAWVLSTPHLNSSDTLTVDLGSTHDHLSMAYRLRIVDDDGNVVQGEVALGPEEKSWLFTPRTPWRDTDYQLVVDERLEDVAGNRPGVLFDRPISATPKAWMRARLFRPTRQDG